MDTPCCFIAGQRANSLTEYETEEVGQAEIQAARQGGKWSKWSNGHASTLALWHARSQAGSQVDRKQSGGQSRRQDSNLNTARSTAGRLGGEVGGVPLTNDRGVRRDAMVEGGLERLWMGVVLRLVRG